MRRYPNRCPSCGGDLIVTELSCTSCDTVVRGAYSGCSFCGLSDESLRFLEIFVTCRGNVKEMERETGLGYWTIRGKLDDVVKEFQALIGPTSPERDPKTERRDILDRLDRGEISLEQAEEMLLNLAK
jgi:hypothetical protein